MEAKNLEVNSILYTKEQACPICDQDIMVRAVKSGKLRLVKSDLDLRPCYDSLNPLFYEVIVCNHCGYAALSKTFSKVSSKGRDLIRKKIGDEFVSRVYPDIYDFDIALERFKLALLTAVVSEAKQGERALICLKIAWIYRGFLEIEPIEDQAKWHEYQQHEMEYLGYALQAFKVAYEQEDLPIMGMDENTIKYLIGELSRRTGHLNEALRWISDVVVSRASSRRLKERALEVKALIKESAE